VIGMKFREEDELLSMSVVKENTFVFTVTDRGYGKRTAVEKYPLRGRAGLGVIAAKTIEDRGHLIGALIVEENDEVLAITQVGGVIRTRVGEVRETGRDTMGVQLIHVGKKDAVVAIARNADPGDLPEDETVVAEGDDSGTGNHPGEATVTESGPDTAPESEL
jgi:DNA gyrase subunit A